MGTNDKNGRKAPGGIAALFDDLERKELFRKYLIFLAWLEVAIFVGCWIYQLGTRGYDRFGPVEIPFPWKVYFLVAFLAPVAVTFLIGTIVVGFNRYFGEPAAEDGDGSEGEEPVGKDYGKTHRVAAAVNWLQKLPYLGLLVVLAAGIGLVYNLDVVLDIAGRVGEQTIQLLRHGGRGHPGSGGLLRFGLFVPQLQAAQAFHGIPVQKRGGRALRACHPGRQHGDQPGREALGSRQEVEGRRPVAGSPNGAASSGIAREGLPSSPSPDLNT